MVSEAGSEKSDDEKNKARVLSAMERLHKAVFNYLGGSSQGVACAKAPGGGVVRDGLGPFVAPVCPLKLAALAASCTHGPQRQGVACGVVILSRSTPCRFRAKAFPPLTRCFVLVTPGSTCFAPAGIPARNSLRSHVSLRLNSASVALSSSHWEMAQHIVRR